MSLVLLNKDQIKEIIPHREPFLLIDEIIALDPGKCCTARTYIQPDAFWFQGHFPENPITPGVLMVEMLAQTGAVCVGAMPEHRGKTALFAKLDKAKFKRLVLPGDMLTLEIEMIKLRGQVGVGRGTAAVNGDLAVSGEFTFMFQK